MAFEEYENPEDLKRVQRLSTLILAELDRVCRKLEIPYVVFAGTALGAVRHGGFMPWDDDVDVAMARADYERFLTEAPKEFDQRFYIANSSNEGDIVFDPFSGTGSTLVAAKELNRQWIGYEIDGEYYNIAVRRINEAKQI